MYGFSGVGVVVNNWGYRTQIASEELVWSQVNCDGIERSLFDCSRVESIEKPWTYDGFTMDVCHSQETLGAYCFDV